jgi:hypothetical protein
MNRSALVLASLLSLIRPSAAQDPLGPAVGTKDLIAHPLAYDGKDILFEGEAIGDPMKRGGYAWVNVLDSDAAMGIFMPSGYLASIKNYGSSRRKGDTLRVRGVFRRACPDHGGDMDIHASSIEVVKKGYETPHPINTIELALIPVFFLLASILFARWRKSEATIKPGTRLS